MKMTRRQLVARIAAGGAGAWLLRSGKAWAWDQSPLGIRKFVAPLPGLGPTGIPVASPVSATVNGIVEDQYRIRLGSYRQQLHPDLPETTLLGYADVTGGKAPNFRYLGGAIAAARNRPVRIVFENRLPKSHPLPIDTSLDGADPSMGTDRASVHLHGGFVNWTSDGGPFAWWSPDGSHGESFLNGTGVAGEAEVWYPNQQSARLLWYHDHAMGLTRVNAYAGLATGYILGDDAEAILVGARILPGLGSGQDIPLILQDKTFFDGNDSSYPVASARRGDLWYPHLYQASSLPDGRWDVGSDVFPDAKFKTPLPEVSCVPEFFGDTSMVNGMPYPFLEVEPRHYRFRILNGSQARFFNLSLFHEEEDGRGWTGEADVDSPGPAILQIGTEGGFLPRPVLLNDPPVPLTFYPDAPDGPTKDNPTPGNAKTYNLLLGPAERADVLVDFSRVPPGSRLILFNDAPSPFPGGDERNTYSTGDPDESGAGGAPSTKPGFGPNSETLMEFRVVEFGATGLAAGRSADHPSYDTLFDEAKWLSYGQLARQTLPPVEALDPSKAAVVRQLTLNEDFDEYGRLIQTLGTNAEGEPFTEGQPASYGLGYEAEATEVAQVGSTEVWVISNLTMDTHPIHFHLANVQIVERRSFDPERYDGDPAKAFTGVVRRPDPNEAGWKETVRINPYEALTVVMKLDLPVLPKGAPAVPVSPRTGGHEYVWHCHILEHEEHDMMRPFIVKP